MEYQLSHTENQYWEWVESHGELHFIFELKILRLSWNTQVMNCMWMWLNWWNIWILLAPTKRSVFLKFSANLFDSLGFLGSFTVKQKIMFQSLCCNKGWTTRWWSTASMEMYTSWSEGHLKGGSAKMLFTVRKAQMMICQSQGFSQKKHLQLLFIYMLNMKSKNHIDIKNQSSTNQETVHSMLGSNH